jgi:hypothetical protein
LAAKDSREEERHPSTFTTAVFFTAFLATVGAAQCPQEGLVGLKEDGRWWWQLSGGN